KLDVLTDQARKHFLHFSYHEVQIHDSGFKYLHAAEGQQLAGHGYRPVGSLLNLLDAVTVGTTGDGSIQQDVTVAPDDREQIIEIMSYATREPAYCFHLMSLAEALLKLLLFGERFLQVRTHSIKGSRHFGHFVSA